MRLNNTWLTHFRQHPLWIALVIAIGLVAWVGSIGYAYIIEPVPSEEQIAGQTVRLNENGLQTVTDQLERFRLPAESPTFSTNPFRTTP